MKVFTLHQDKDQEWDKWMVYQATFAPFLVTMKVYGIEVHVPCSWSRSHCPREKLASNCSRFRSSSLWISHQQIQQKQSRQRKHSTPQNTRFWGQPHTTNTKSLKSTSRFTIPPCTPSLNWVFATGPIYLHAQQVNLNPKQWIYVYLII